MEQTKIDDDFLANLKRDMGIKPEDKMSPSDFLKLPSVKDNPGVQLLLSMGEDDLRALYSQSISEVVRAVTKHFGMVNAYKNEPSAFTTLGLLSMVAQSREIQLNPKPSTPAPAGK